MLWGWNVSETIGIRAGKIKLFGTKGKYILLENYRRKCNLCLYLQHGQCQKRIYTIKSFLNFYKLAGGLIKFQLSFSIFSERSTIVQPKYDQYLYNLYFVTFLYWLSNCWLSLSSGWMSSKMLIIRKSDTYVWKSNIFVDLSEREKTGSTMVLDIFKTDMHSLRPRVELTPLHSRVR